MSEGSRMLYLMQHGAALTKSENPERPLSEQGLDETQKMAQLSRLIKVNKVVHSGKLRAQQTAEIMAKALQMDAEAQEGLAPNDPIPPLANLSNALIVGHLPHLNKLASYLVTGDEKSDVVKFRNSGVVCIDEGRICWLAWPEFF